MPDFTKRKTKLHIQLSHSGHATARGGQVLIDAFCRRFVLWQRPHDEPLVNPPPARGRWFFPGRLRRSVALKLDQRGGFAGRSGASGARPRLD